MQDPVPGQDMGKRMGGGGLSLSPVISIIGWGRFTPSRPAHRLVVGDDGYRPEGKQRVVRVQVDRCCDQVIVPVLCFPQFIRRGTAVNIHDINSMACLTIGSSNLVSAVDCIQYQNMHTKKSEKGKSLVCVLDHKVGKERVAPYRVCV